MVRSILQLLPNTLCTYIKTRTLEFQVMNETISKVQYQYTIKLIDLLGCYRPLLIVCLIFFYTGLSFPYLPINPSTIHHPPSSHQPSTHSIHQFHNSSSRSSSFTPSFPFLVLPFPIPSLSLSIPSPPLLAPSLKNSHAIRPSSTFQ